MKLRHRRIFIAGASALATMGLATAVAQATPPAAPYQDFAGCPSRAENPEVASCVKFEFSGGYLKLGKREVPIANPFALRGGEEFTTHNFLGNSEAGITPVRQPVPGGLIGLTGYKWLDEAVGSTEQLKLYATIESAGTPGSLGHLPISLPIKIHLENQFLGNGCYIGSNTKPITLDLTTGTTAPPAPNMPITGQPTGELEEEAGRPAVEKATGGIFVDNAFAVPGVSGCQINIGSHHLSINEVVDSAYGLPAAAGKNTAVLDYSLSLVSPEVVYP